MSDLKGGYFYLATPYTNYPNGIEASFTDSCIIAARLTKMGLIVFSPVVHSHAISVHGDINPKDHELWMAIDRPMVNAARGLIVAMLSGWDESLGVKVEIDLFKQAGKPIFYLNPDDLPPYSMRQSAQSQQNVVAFMVTQRTTSTEPTG